MCWSSWSMVRSPATVFAMMTLNSHLGIGFPNRVQWKANHSRRRSNARCFRFAISRKGVRCRCWLLGIGLMPFFGLLPFRHRGTLDSQRTRLFERMGLVPQCQSLSVHLDPYHPSIAPEVLAYLLRPQCALRCRIFALQDHLYCCQCGAMLRWIFFHGLLTFLAQVKYQIWQRTRSGPPKRRGMFLSISLHLSIHAVAEMPCAKSLRPARPPRTL